MQKLTIRTPDDWHAHFRSGVILKESLEATSRCFARAVAMPNLIPPLTKPAAILEYQRQILAEIPEGKQFKPVMTMFLTDETSIEDIKEAFSSGILAAKLYPAGVTTNSASAVDSVQALFPIFEEMASLGMLLLVHGEVNDLKVDIFDREAVFIEKHLLKIVEAYPKLKIVFEHITTRQAVEFVRSASDNVAATITPQHLLLNRNDLLVGGIKPHNYCLPILKRSTHQLALQDIVRTGSKKFFLGTDSAPHEKHQKESACGCAGCYSAPVAIELYTQIFEDLDALDKLENFASHFGADFYGLPRNEGSITLVKESWKVPEQIKLASGEILIPFLAGQNLKWKLWV